MKTKYPTTGANIYEDGAFEIFCECVGQDKCPLKLSEVMPASKDADCVYCDHSECRSNEMRNRGLRALVKEINLYMDED